MLNLSFKNNTILFTVLVIVAILFVSLVCKLFFLNFEQGLYYNENQIVKKYSADKTDIASTIGPIVVESEEIIGKKQNFTKVDKERQSPFCHLKLIPLNIDDKDLNLISQMGFSVLASEEGVNDIDTEEMKHTLDRIYKHGLKMIVDAGFSSGAWGYKEDGSDDPEQEPVWQKEKMQNWVLELKDHPAIYGWDISNEAGENLPNGNRYRISLAQLKQASIDIRQIDSTRPVMIRMHYWDEEDGDFGRQNPFAPEIADIVMLNLYSNYSLDGQTALLPDMVNDSAKILIDKIAAIDPNVKIWLSLAAFEEQPMFLNPSVTGIRQDIQSVLKLANIESIGFFGWGEPMSNWYLPRDGKEILSAIQVEVKK